jgi:hypothetical protein
MTTVLIQTGESLFFFCWLKDVFTIGKIVDRINATNRMDDMIELAKGG